MLKKKEGYTFFSQNQPSTVWILAFVYKGSVVFLPRGEEEKVPYFIFNLTFYNQSLF